MTALSSLRVRISRRAMVENGRRMIGRSGAEIVADLRRDALGHGAAETAAMLVAAGLSAATTTVLTDPEHAGHIASLGLGVAVDDGTARLPEPPGTALLYGLPGSGATPAFGLSGTVLSVKPLRAGEGVSYTHLFVAPADTHIALVTGGYAQGILRELGGRIRVAAGAETFPVVGRIAMDVCVADIGPAEIPVGTEVDFLGGEGPLRDALADWAAESGWTAAEILCGIGARVRREWTA